MPHFSFYPVITDNVVLNLPNFDPNNSDENLSTQRALWTPPGDMVTSTDGEKRPVLWYNVDLDNADEFVLQVQVRNVMMLTTRFRDF